MKARKNDSGKKKNLKRDLYQTHKISYIKIYTTTKYFFITLCLCLIDVIYNLAGSI